MNIAHEEKKEPESYGDKEIMKTVAEKSVDSIALFSEIYEKHIGKMVSINVSWTPIHYYY